MAVFTISEMACSAGHAHRLAPGAHHYQLLSSMVLDCSVFVFVLHCLEVLNTRCLCAVSKHCVLINFSFVKVIL
jgi:hypothetical protein